MSVSVLACFHPPYSSQRSLFQARGILLGENELEPFPARAPPPPREVGTRKVPASPDEYLWTDLARGRRADKRRSVAGRNE